MFFRNCTFAAAFLWGAAAFAAPANPQEFTEYKKNLLRDPALIRLYTFEEGSGEEAANQVMLDPGRIAMTGGPLGSLTLHRLTPFGSDMHDVHGGHYTNDVRSPEWTRGRFPWKSAVRSGNTRLGMYRSGITGAEFTEGGTISGWFRPDEAEGGCDIFKLGDAWSVGFRLSYSYNKHAPQGALHFNIGDQGKTGLWATPCAPGVWHHFAVVIGKEKVELYIDGALKAEKPFAGKVIPVKGSEHPVCTPFYEYSPGFATYLLIGSNPIRKDQEQTRFDLGELAIYKRPLTAAEVAAQRAAGSPAGTVEEQHAESKALAAERKKLDAIEMSIPIDTDGYFRLGKSIPATFKIPAETGFGGRYTARAELETLYGKPVGKFDKALTPGAPQTIEIAPPGCGIYWLDLAVIGMDGKVVKRLPRKFGIGIVTPAPQKLSEHNPMAFWADSDKFHFDSPIRRMNYHPDPNIRVKMFEDNYDRYNKLIPDFRAYVWFYSRYVKPQNAAEDRKFNRDMFTEAAKVFQGKSIMGFEMSSEPHDIDTAWYVQHLADARELFDAAGLKKLPMVPPGGAPPSLPMIADILKNGGVKYMDGISYHPYPANPVGAFLWDNTMTKLREVADKYQEKKFIFWNTEGGVNSLPRLRDRPMTRKDAHAMRLPSAQSYGHEMFLYFISMVPEDEAAALQCHAIMLDMVNGYKIYTICQTPNVEAMPSLRGVAVTALAGQVLNNHVAATRMPLAGVENMCLLFKQSDGSAIASLFSMEPAVLTLRLKPGTAYKTMDMLGNYSTLKTDRDGIVTVNSNKHPLYIFGVPADFAEVMPLKLTAPQALTDKGGLKGEVLVTNPFNHKLAGTLSATPIRGATIALGQTKIDLAPGASIKIPVELQATFLKRRPYALGINLKDGSGKVLSAAQTIFDSPGVILMVPRFRQAVQLDGDEAKWTQVPEVVCDDADSVVHGKPNFAEVWVPQWINKEDLSFSVKVAYRKGESIYFLLKVTDNVVIPAPEDKTSMAFRYDCLEFFFDGRKAAELGSTISAGADQAVVIPQATASLTPCNLWYAKSGQEHIRVECVGKKTAGGYLIEGKVTPNGKSTFKVEPGSQFRMDFLVDDTDSLELRQLRKSAMALHGLFSNFIDSNVWGRYELSLDTVR